VKKLPFIESLIEHRNDLFIKVKDGKKSRIAIQGKSNSMQQKLQTK